MLWRGKRCGIHTNNELTENSRANSCFNQWIVKASRFHGPTCSISDKMRKQKSYIFSRGFFFVICLKRRDRWGCCQAHSNYVNMLYEDYMVNQQKLLNYFHAYHKQTQVQLPHTGFPWTVSSQIFKILSVVRETEQSLPLFQNPTTGPCLLLVPSSSQPDNLFP